jgi:lipopolysaccharide biosynthesis protein
MTNEPIKIRAIAYYLPQFHPIPENDAWWGKGFTEWTNVGKAKRYFRGHYQPRVPADLGYYDLRVPETRQAQADMARSYGIEGFCYWHYWFGKGKRLLERPFNEVLSSGEPDFGFCLGWANESWKGFEHGLKNRNVLIEQQYPGPTDHEQHFYEVLPAFLDKRYIKVHGKPLFVIYKPLQLPDARSFIQQWQNMALKNGLDGIFFIGHTYYFEEFSKILDMKFNAINLIRWGDYKRLNSTFTGKIFDKIIKEILSRPYIVPYQKVIQSFTGPEDKEINCFPALLSGWDHSPRSGKHGVVFHHATPQLFEQHASIVFDQVKHKPTEDRIVFIKSWNEWAEGNYMEPDLRYGTGFLEALKSALSKIQL